ncbi:MAG: polymer-forming cytoskeletal protein [Deltaproteobacteria bacterium]|jgi:cytoskeletal protein CcmA (bactofilin family)|nr:polymer-forming cytoskeletal protein [Deltaproteobacteria bacterium]
MFNKKTYAGLVADTEKNKTTDSRNKNIEQNENSANVPKDVPIRPSESAVSNSSVNKILKGSKLLGDINIACDLELSGDVEGNITSTQGSNIMIKGICKGNIETKEGSVDIEGELNSGNIMSGKDVKITGKFNGGEVQAVGKIFIDGEFNGKLEGNEIEIGPNSVGKGEIFYKEYISISKGAKVEVKISQSREALREIKIPTKTKPEDTKQVQKITASK